MSENFNIPEIEKSIKEEFDHMIAKIKIVINEKYPNTIALKGFIQLYLNDLIREYDAS